MLVLCCGLPPPQTCQDNAVVYFYLLLTLGLTTSLWAPPTPPSSLMPHLQMCGTHPCSPLNLWPACSVTDPQSFPFIHISLSLPRTLLSSLPPFVTMSRSNAHSTPSPFPPDSVVRKIFFLFSVHGHTMLHFCAKLKNKLVPSSASMPSSPPQYLMAGGHASCIFGSIKGSTQNCWMWLLLASQFLSNPNKRETVSSGRV